MDNDQDKFIAYLVEKVTKGVRKQIRGYVQNIQNEINSTKQRVDYSLADFKDIYDRSKRIRADFEAFEIMLDEGLKQKKLWIESKKMIEETNDKLMDMNFLKIELENQLKAIKKGMVNE